MAVLMGRHPLAYRRGRRLGVLSVMVLLVVLLIHSANYAHGFWSLPVMHIFAVSETSGNKLESRVVCQQRGGFLASETTGPLHDGVIEAVRGAGAGDEWYAYLGASTRGNGGASCPPALSQQTLQGPNGQSFGCYWRWDEGRWREVEDNPDLPLYAERVGLTFSIGNYFQPPRSPTVLNGRQNGFPVWFEGGETTLSMRRPSAMFGQDLVAVGGRSSSTWSDNEDRGGYSYANYIFGPFYNTSVWDPVAKADTRAKFWAVCEVQNPTRSYFEKFEPTELEDTWWVIYFVFLTVACFVSFVVVLCCQEREDMDEPPEDAPVWAQEEMNNASRTKSFVSTRSFAQRDNDSQDNY